MLENPNSAEFHSLLLSTPALLSGNSWGRGERSVGRVRMCCHYSILIILLFYNPLLSLGIPHKALNLLSGDFLLYISAFILINQYCKKHSSHSFTNHQRLFFYCQIKPNQLRLAFIMLNNVTLPNCPVFHSGIHLATWDSFLMLPFFKSKFQQRSSQKLSTVTTFRLHNTDWQVALFSCSI